MKAAQTYFKFAILILFVTVCFSACITPGTDDNAPANMILPFDDDGVFIFTSSQFEDQRVDFHYAEGREDFSEWGGAWYMAENFRLYAADFVNIMNSLEPVLTDVISTDCRFSNPFKWFAHDNYLYRIHIYHHLDGYSFHMSVHKTEDYGYLYFVIS